jgi:hypothetical protein
VQKLVIKLCYAIKSIKSFANKNMVRTMYFVHMHSSLKYGILFWENVRNIQKVFKTQKIAVSLIANIQRIKDYDTALCIYF